MTGKRVAGAVLATALLCTGAVACGGSDDGKAKGAGSGETQSRSQVTEVITAAYEKTAKAKSAKVEMTMTAPKSMGGGSEDMKMSGVMGWDPTVMDMTMSGSALTDNDPEAPEKVRMLWLDNVMYMDMGAVAAKDMDGKQWVKMDLNTIAEQVGDEKAAKQLTGGLDSMNQDPAQQLAMLLDSPNLKHVGSADVDGVETQRYKGRLSVKEMMESNKGLDEMLGKSEREELLKGIEKSGIKGYDTEVWVNEDDYPVRMDIDIKSPDGTMKTSQKFTDYGAAAEVTPPPAGKTFDLMDMFKELEGLGKPDSDSDV